MIRHYDGGLGDLFMQLHCPGGNGYRAWRYDAIAQPPTEIHTVEYKSSTGHYQTAQPLFDLLGMRVYPGKTMAPTENQYPWQLGYDRFDPIYLPEPYNGRINTNRPICLFHFSASSEERRIPEYQARQLLRYAKNAGYHPVIVGAAGEREQSWVVPGVTNRVGKITIPLLWQLVQSAARVVCTHSSVCILSWINHRDQHEFSKWPDDLHHHYTLLVVPDDFRGHQHGERWSFGLSYPGNEIAAFSSVGSVAARWFGVAEDSDTLEARVLWERMEGQETRIRELERRLRGV